MGYYAKQFTRPVIDQSTGEVDYMVLAKPQTIYYIPFSKKKVDEIIESSAHSTKDDIIFTIKFQSEDCPWGPRAPTRSQFQYEQFANLNWEDIYKMHVKPHIQATMEYKR